MQVHKQIPNNRAVRTLMDDALMVGRHRPIVAKWFQDWVEELNVSGRLKYPDPSKPVEVAAFEDAKEALRAELAEKLKEEFMSFIQFSEAKVCLADGWRPGKPAPKGADMGIEIKGAVQIFRNSSKSDKTGAALSPTDSKAVLSRAPQAG